jgi:hypothetical protein
MQVSALGGQLRISDKQLPNLQHILLLTRFPWHHSQSEKSIFSSPRNVAERRTRREDSERASEPLAVQPGLQGGITKIIQIQRPWDLV